MTVHKPTTVQRAIKLIDQSPAATLDELVELLEAVQRFSQRALDGRRVAKENRHDPEPAGVQVDWSKVQDEAACVAMDENTEWWWYAIKPREMSNRWFPDDAGDDHMFIGYDCGLQWANGVPWDETLTERPVIDEPKLSRWVERDDGVWPADLDMTGKLVRLRGVDDPYRVRRRGGSYRNFEIYTTEGFMLDAFKVTNNRLGKSDYEIIAYLDEGGNK